MADDYGLDVWVWYPAMDPDYSDPRTVESALREWAEVFKAVPRIDAVFVPGGDPGQTQPKYMLAFMEKQAENLRRFHPRAQMWMSPQSFDETWLQEFLEIINREQLRWLDGIVYGPQNRLGLSALRKKVPERYPIRLYPDITHSTDCQFPVAAANLAIGLSANLPGSRLTTWSGCPTTWLRSSRIPATRSTHNPKNNSQRLTRRFHMSVINAVTIVIPMIVKKIALLARHN